jgi:outer membrane protein OmpA-like peptidoglycan-associated protein
MLDTYEPGFLMNSYTNRTDVNTGTAAFLFFLDENLDGVYNQGEQVIPDVRVSTASGSIDRSRGHSLAYIYNLQPYRRINTYVNMESISNPLWIPEKSAFSFIADPNNVKGMEIPCYASGIIEGKVSKIVGNKSLPVLGIKLHVLKSDSSFNQIVPVFSDGSFYFLGVPPGDYKIWVDSTQMALLGLFAKEPYKEFRIEVTTQGDYVGGINIDVYPNYVKNSQEDNLPSSNVNNKINRPNNSDAGRGGNQLPSKPLAKPPSSLPADSLLGNKVVEKKLLLYKESADYDLTVEMKDFLDYASAYLRSHASSRLNIRSFAGNSLLSDQAKNLTDKRAQKALDYLIQKGLSPDRIYSVGLGNASDAGNLSGTGKNINKQWLEVQILD